MKIVFFGYDYTLDIAQRLVGEGHELLKIFTFPCDEVFAFTSHTQEYAQHFQIPITDQPVTANGITSLIDQGCDLFLCAGYPYKIPDINSEQARGINVHPSLLPHARGVMPLPFIIMYEPKAAGFTIHKLANDFDAGDILYQEAIAINETTDVETLSAQIAVKAPNAVSKVVAGLEQFWNDAKPQDHSQATTYSAPTEKDRLVNWHEAAETINRKAKAFGRYGMLAVVQNNVGDIQNLAVFNLTAWSETHTQAAGSLVRSSPREIVVTIEDGYACLKEFQVIENI